MAVPQNSRPQTSPHRLTPLAYFFASTLLLAFGVSFFACRDVRPPPLATSTPTSSTPRSAHTSSPSQSTRCTLPTSVTPPTPPPPLQPTHLAPAWTIHPPQGIRRVTLARGQLWVQEPQARDFRLFDPTTGHELDHRADFAPLGDLESRVVDIGSIVAVTAGGSLHGLDPIQLTPRWTRVLGESGSIARIESSLGNLLAVSVSKHRQPSRLFVVDGVDGTLCWKQPQAVDSWFRQVVIDRQHVYAMTTYPHRMMAFQLASGDVAWRWDKPRSDLIWAWLIGLDLHVATPDRGLERLDLTTGLTLQQWPMPLASMEVAEGPTKGTVFVLESIESQPKLPLNQAVVSAWSLTEQKRLWQSRVHVSEHSPMLIDGTTLYTCTEDERIQAIDSQTGAEIWDYGFEEQGDAFLGRCELTRVGGMLIHRAGMFGESLTGFASTASPVAAVDVTVTGRIRVDGRPRAGVLVQVGGQAVRTDSAGRYKLRIMRRGALQVTLDCDELHEQLQGAIATLQGCWKSTREGDHGPAHVDFDLKTEPLSN